MAVGIAIAIVMLAIRIWLFCIGAVARIVWFALRLIARFAVALLTIVYGFCTALGGWLARKYKARRIRLSQAQAVRA